MIDSGLIDLHLHTCFSDGTDTPAELLEIVKEKGLTLFSVTDHDSVKACLELSAILESSCPAFLTGVEFSCRDGEGKYHILGYGYDPSAESIRTITETGHDLRLKNSLSVWNILRATSESSSPLMRSRC